MTVFLVLALIAAMATIWILVVSFDVCREGKDVETWVFAVICGPVGWAMLADMAIRRLYGRNWLLHIGRGSAMNLAPFSSICLISYNYLSFSQQKRWKSDNNSCCGRPLTSRTRTRPCLLGHMVEREKCGQRVQDHKRSCSDVLATSEMGIVSHTWDHPDRDHRLRKPSPTRVARRRELKQLDQQTLGWKTQGFFYSAITPPPKQTFPL